MKKPKDTHVHILHNGSWQNQNEDRHSHDISPPIAVPGFIHIIPCLLQLFKMIFNALVICACLRIALLVNIKIICCCLGHGEIDSCDKIL